MPIDAQAEYERLKADVRVLKAALEGLPEDFLRSTIASLLLQVIGDRDEALKRIATMRTTLGMPLRPGVHYKIEETD